MIQVCTVGLEVLIKNYFVSCVDKSTELKTLYSPSLQEEWREEFLANAGDLLSQTDADIICALRKEFANGKAKDFLNQDDYDQILKMQEEGADYCVRVMDGNETLCLLSKKEIK
jgi:hypothetical protein